jgi:hypothetical protein
MSYKRNGIVKAAGQTLSVNNSIIVKKKINASMGLHVVRGII